MLPLLLRWVKFLLVFLLVCSSEGWFLCSLIWQSFKAFNVYVFFISFFSTELYNHAVLWFVLFFFLFFVSNKSKNDSYLSWHKMYHCNMEHKMRIMTESGTNFSRAWCNIGSLNWRRYHHINYSICQVVISSYWKYTPSNCCVANWTNSKVPLAC